MQRGSSMQTAGIFAAMCRNTRIDTKIPALCNLVVFLKTKNIEKTNGEIWAMKSNIR